MKKIAPALAVLPLALLSAQSHAVCFRNDMGNGYTSINCDDGTRGMTHMDEYGNTNGHVGGEPINMQTNEYGHTTGMAGGHRINMQRDAIGNNFGTIDRRVVLINKNPIMRGRAQTSKRKPQYTEAEMNAYANEILEAALGRPLRPEEKF